MQGQLHKKYLGSETKMEFLEDGVKLNFEEYAEVMRALHALAALRPIVPSFNTDFNSKSVTTVEVEP